MIASPMIHHCGARPGILNRDGISPDIGAEIHAGRGFKRGATSTVAADPPLFSVMVPSATSESPFSFGPRTEIRRAVHRAERAAGFRCNHVVGCPGEADTAIHT